MKFRIASAFHCAPLSVALLASCAHSTAPEPGAVRAAIAIAASRVQSCYRSPRVPFEARQIVTRLRVRYAPDGQPASLPVVVSQGSVTPANRAYADEMAQAAVSAVLRCGQMRLPPDLHSGGWDDFDLTFSPGAVV